MRNERHDRGDRFEAPTYEKVKAKESDLDYKNVELLKKCVGGQGQMFSRRRTGLTAQRQRLLKNAIKRARHMGLLSFVD
ncbi:MAG: 30S ribosomal protein S18 [Planctomycetes bacterium]|nr:30S ribosomal protein S18 [Planctomycetota bacterium]